MMTARKAQTCWLIQNLGGKVMPMREAAGASIWLMPGQKLVITMPKTAKTDPMIAAPEAAVNMAPVRFHQRLMYSVGVKTVLKKKANAATPVTARRSIQMC